ncbi:MAG: hypothetical protein ACLVDZ_05875 [Ruminococcus sp.]|nr:hypothetical protein [Bacillota bacterium]
MDLHKIMVSESSLFFNRGFPGSTKVYFLNIMMRQSRQSGVVRAPE